MSDDKNSAAIRFIPVVMLMCTSLILVSTSRSGASHSFSEDPKRKEITVDVRRWALDGRLYEFNRGDGSTCGQVYGPDIDKDWHGWTPTTNTTAFDTEAQAFDRVMLECKPNQPTTDRHQLRNEELLP